MPFCYYCGFETKSKYCANCGAKIIAPGECHCDKEDKKQNFSSKPKIDIFGGGFFSAIRDLASDISAQAQQIREDPKVKKKILKELKKMDPEKLGELDKKIKDKTENYKELVKKADEENKRALKKIEEGVCPDCGVPFAPGQDCCEECGASLERKWYDI